MNTKEECKGIFGKIFGHKYKSYLLEEKSPTPFPEFNIQGNDIDLVSILEKINSKQYDVICKRCGKRVQ